ncbi:MAG TPA: MarR family transcriptional regulator [Thermomicrobiales bacterium]|nr:MarR family transcriptional regulator [Thermomicrobiales bacterium]
METLHELAQPRLIGALLRIPFQATVTRVYEDVVAAGYTDLRPAHFTPFQHLRPEGSHITELAERAQMTKQSMGYLVDYLEARGYVERVLDPADGRAKLVRLTTRGRALARVARASLERLEAEWARRLGSDSMAHLHRLLEELVAVVEQPSARG